MEYNKCKNVIDSLKPYDYFAKEEDYISVTEWHNGEGYDIDLNGKQFIHLTHGELEAINYLIKSIDYEKFENNETDK